MVKVNKNDAHICPRFDDLKRARPTAWTTNCIVKVKQETNSSFVPFSGAAFENLIARSLKFSTSDIVFNDFGEV